MLGTLSTTMYVVAMILTGFCLVGAVVVTNQDGMSRSAFALIASAVVGGLLFMVIGAVLDGLHRMVVALESVSQRQRSRGVMPDKGLTR